MIISIRWCPMFELIIWSSSLFAFLDEWSLFIGPLPSSFSCSASKSSSEDRLAGRNVASNLWITFGCNGMTDEADLGLLVLIAICYRSITLDSRWRKTVVVIEKWMITVVGELIQDFMLNCHYLASWILRICNLGPEKLCKIVQCECTLLSDRLCYI